MPELLNCTNLLDVLMLGQQFVVGYLVLVLGVFQYLPFILKNKKISLARITNLYKFAWRVDAWPIMCSVLGYFLLLVLGVFQYLPSIWKNKKISLARITDLYKFAWCVDAWPTICSLLPSACVRCPLVTVVHLKEYKDITCRNY